MQKKVRNLYYSLSDSMHSLLGRGNPLLPPPELIESIGGGDFDAIGQEFLGHFTRVGGLRADDRVLDIGSGCGRMAVPLMRYISRRGGYWGFEIMPDCVRWCERHIAPKRSNFHFLHADIFNKLYNPGGRFEAGEYVFPYEDDFFDFVFLTSIFTHMLAADVRHYLAEIARVLKPGGRCMASFFVLNEESRSLMKSGAASINFRFELPGCYTSSEETPEAAIAFDENRLRGTIQSAGLRIVEPLHFGSWCGREEHLTYQDIVLAVKET